jgi:cytochrome c oxidase subunit 3
MTQITAEPQTSGDQSGHGHADDHHSGEHAKYPFLAHHFETPAQQFDSAKLGMWLFLATEVLFFGALFVAYAVLRSRFPEVFSYASHYLDTVMGGVNTCVLIVSSLTMALAVYFAQRGKKFALVLCLWLTMGGAVGFLVIKYFEYTHKIHENLVWGPSFYVPPHGQEGELEASVLSKAPAPAANPVPAPTDPSATGLVSLAARPPADASAIKPAQSGPKGLGVWSAPTAAAAAAMEPQDPIPAEAPSDHLADPKLPPNTHLFFAIYYAMTGLHGIHVVVGMIVIGMLIFRATRGDFGPNYYTPVDLVGLYWHIVDLVWIFLFPLFYLIH